MAQSLTLNRNTILFGAKFAASAGLLAYLLYKLDFRLPPINAGTVTLIAISVAMLTLQPVLIALRWQRLLTAFNIPMSNADAIRITWISVFANQFLPASVGGDVVRVVMTRGRNLGLAGAIMSVFFDRGFALLSLFALIVVLSPFLLDFEQGRIAIYISAGLAAVGIIGLALIVLLAPTLQRFVAGRPALAKYENLIASSRILIADRKLLSYVTAQSTAVHILSFLAYSLIARAFGVDIRMMTLLALAGLVTLAHILPISIAGWGVRDAASVALLSAAGVDATVALSISLLLGAGYAIASIPGALLWLTSR
jgi:uncharacterized membrane protein YbhN (UPF0104 family)